MFNVTPCPHCGHVEELTHWNPPGTLPLVDSDILIKIPAGTQTYWADGTECAYYCVDTVERVHRSEYLRNKDGDMTYRLPKGEYITGKYMWTHP